MLPLGMVLGFVGYGIGTWGYIVERRINITLREWFSPLHPFTGSFDSAGQIPAGSVFPTTKGGSSGTAGSGSGSPVPGMEQKAGNIARKQNRPVPQGPGSRL